MKKIAFGIKLLLVILLSLLFALPFFLENQFGEMEFEMILFLFVSETGGANTDIVNQFIIYALPYVAVFVFLYLFYHILTSRRYEFNVRLLKKHLHFVIDFNHSLKRTLVVALSVIIVILYFANSQLNVSGYIMSRINAGEFYEEYYVDPNDVEISFPEEKQNLIYIVLESMSTNFNSVVVDQEIVNLIPNLEGLAQDNINFSNSEEFGGHLDARSLTWTVASLVGQTAGVPLQIPIDGNSYGTNGIFLPGITTLGEILEDNGYANYFFMGSDANYGGRQTYFETHGNYTIYDYKYMIETGFIPEDYQVFWGMEDSKLFEFAKIELLEIAANDEPFNVSILTVDSHFTDGYTDPLCEVNYSIAYANALACSDYLVTQFVSWIQAQDFYENTTIIVVGDHNTMNYDFLQRTTNEEKYVYNAFINVNVDTSDVNTQMRTFTVMDYFPTTLAALGVSIEGDMLGLGTNLFSNQETLPERLGFTFMNDELGKKSNYYEDNFLR